MGWIPIGLVVLISISSLYVVDAAGCNITSVDITSNPTSVPEIGSTTVYTFTCTVAVVCGVDDNDTLTISIMSPNGSNSVLPTMAINANTTVTHNLTLGSPIATSDAGLYGCTATVVDGSPMMMTDSAAFNVQLPTPIVTSQGSSVVQISENSTVQCDVALESLDLYPNDTSVTVIWTTDQPNNLNDRTIAAAADVIDKRTFQSSLVNAGTYNCFAFVSHINEYVMNSANSSVAVATVTITIATPTVTVTSVIVAINNNAVLNCTVDNVLEPDLTTAAITWSPNNGIPTDNGLSSQYTISSVSIDDTGLYTCLATISANTGNAMLSSSNIVTSPTGSGNGTVYATDLSVTQSDNVLLDVAPYNNFSLQCMLMYYPTGANSIDVAFSFSDNNTNGNSMSDVIIISSGNPRSRNQSVTITTAGQYQYTCMVTVNATGVDNDFMNSDSISITVKGPSTPNPPELLNTNVTPNSATVRWQVPSVLYTPETFIVYYGLTNNNFNYSVDGGVSMGMDDRSFLTDINIMYSANINGLTSGIKYYYLINSTNSIGSTLSEVGEFTTSESPPSMPTNVILTTLTATSLTLKWSPPVNPNGNITSYSYSCGANNNTRQTNPITGSVESLSDIIMNLIPYTEYQCSVNATNSAGTSAPDTAIGVTGQAAPDGSPTGFTLTPSNTNSGQLSLSWGPPELNLRNGIIILYHYGCDLGTDNAPVRNFTTPNTTVVLNDLLTFTEYNCSVSAATIVGEGDAVTMRGNTSEAAPSAVRDVSSNGINATTFFIMWTAPMTLNGIIIHYNVTIVLYTTNVTVYQKNATDTEVTITSLEAGVPYRIYVSGVTGGGQGSSQVDDVIDFTQQGTPAQVTGVTAMRINGTAVNVTWTPLTIVQAQGFIDAYTVRLEPITGSRKRQAMTIIAMFTNPLLSGGIITGLIDSVTYSVTVSVSNGGGISGPLSPPELFYPIDNESNVTTIIVVIIVIGVIVLLVIVIVIILLSVVFVRMGQSRESLVHENLSVLDDKRQNNNGADQVELLSLKVDQEINERMQTVAMEDFADHVKQLHANRDLGFEEEYESIKRIPPGSYVVAKMQSNVGKNRFDNVYSYDNSRVILPTTGESSDYINASFLDGYKRPKAYIAAQGPLPTTVVDFWRMVWEFQLPTVVMLTELIERGIEKCTCYYPRNNNETMDVGNGLKVTLIEQQQFVEYKFKKFLLLNSGSEGGRLDVTHYHFLAWPDHGVPADKTVMMAFAKRVRQTHPPEGPPLIVHCSAGVGRTGTFIVLDTMMQRIEKKESSLNIYELVADMRRKRTLMVQTMAQYIYTHDALSEYIISGDTSITTKGLRNKMNELNKVSGGESGYQKQFKLLNEISRLPSEGHCSDSLSKQNVVKNRYSQVISSLPYNETRVRLRTTSGVGDYINASIVDGYKHKGAFLATQSPLESTVGDLWRMVWEQWSASIIMLCSTDEEESMYCYWPSEIDQKTVYGMIEVKLISEKEEKDFVVRKFELSQESNYVNLATGNADKLLVTQYQYQKWPLTGKPSNCESLLEMLNQLLKTQKLSGNKAITVMCNDGINRTGAFICLYSQLERVKVEGIADVFQFVKSSRFHRPGLVQSLDNYVFCHEVLLEFLNSFDQYENFK